MRAPALLASLLLTTGCTSYLKSQSRTKSARQEAVDIALGGLSQVLIGGLICVGSHYWYNDTVRNPEPVYEDELSPSMGAVAGLLLGYALVVGGVSDSTIALYQGMSNDYLFASPPPPGVKPVYGPRAPDAIPVTSLSALPAER